MVHRHSTTRVAANGAAALAVLSVFGGWYISLAAAQRADTPSTSRSPSRLTVNEANQEARDDAPSQPTGPQPLSVKTLIGDAVDNPESQQYKNVAAAIETFRTRDIDGARDLLTEARTAQPKLPPVEVIMAKLFALANLPQQARVELEQAVRRHPNDPEPYLMFGDASIMERRVTDAEALYQKAEKLVQAFNENQIRKDNFQKRVLNGLALVAEARQQWEEAEGLLRQYLKLDAKNASIHQRLGRALFQQATPSNKKYAESYNAFVAAVKADSNAVSPDVAMGQLFEQSAQDAQRAKDDAKFKDHRKQAASSFTRATSGANADLKSFLAAATWAIQTNQLKEAQNYADQAMKKDSKSLEAKLARALVARFSGDLKTAEQHLNEAFNQEPGSFAISNQLALVLIDTQDTEKRRRAQQLAEMNYRQYERNAEAASTLGWIYWRLGKEQQAEQALGAVMNSNQLSADSAFYVATILNERGRLPEARQILEAALAQPQPFANRGNAAELLDEIKAKMQSLAEEKASGKEKAKDSKSSSSKTPASTTREAKKTK
jgi:tetratricopeptide (TPR) repeat protein